MRLKQNERYSRAVRAFSVNTLPKWLTVGFCGRRQMEFDTSVLAVSVQNCDRFATQR
jgi:hypothetical protein